MLFSRWYRGSLWSDYFRSLEYTSASNVNWPARKLWWRTHAQCDSETPLGPWRFLADWTYVDCLEVLTTLAWTSRAPLKPIIYYRSGQSCLVTVDAKLNLEPTNVITVNSVQFQATYITIIYTTNKTNLFSIDKCRAAFMLATDSNTNRYINATKRVQVCEFYSITI